MIDWDKIDTVLLDMDGTLLDLHFDNYFWLHHLPMRYAQIHTLDLDSAKNKIHSLIGQLEGSLQWYCFDHWSDILELDIMTLKREVTHKIQVRPFVKDFLTRLREHNKKLVLITNSHPKGLEIKLNITAIDKYLDVIISSHEFNTPKEDMSFWTKLSEQEEFDRERTLFIDDTPRVLRCAKDFGIAHLVCITSPDSQKTSKASNEFIDTDHFDKIMPKPLCNPSTTYLNNK